MKFNTSTLTAVGSFILLSTVLSPAAAGTAPASSSDRPPVLCFAPGTPDWYVQQAIATASLKRVHHSLAGGSESEFQFPDGNRWYRTATDGSGLDQGDPTTLTWSVIPDGTTIPGYAGEADAPSNLRAYLTGIYGDEATWLSILQQVFDRWGALSGVIYEYEPWDDGASFVSSEGSIGNRGDIRIGGHNIDGNSGILAYNFYPDVGDMVIDTGDSSTPTSPATRCGCETWSPTSTVTASAFSTSARSTRPSSWSPITPVHSTALSTTTCWRSTAATATTSKPTTTRPPPRTFSSRSSRFPSTTSRSTTTTTSTTSA